MNFKDENLVLDSEGIIPLEKFLLLLSLMYWQVYLHKISLSAEMILLKIIKRFQSLIKYEKSNLTKKNILFSLLGMTPSETN